MTMIIDGTNGLTFPDTSKQYNSYYNFKNRIINGAMVIDQRNAGASVTPTSTVALVYGIDRWAGFGSVSSKFSMQQNAAAVTPPTGYTNYLGVTSLSAYSVGSAEQFQVLQIIEGFNVADLAWGTASAAPVTLSFWVRSSLTGTFGGALRNGTAARSYPFSYTISAANTWEQKSVTIPGDTSGTWITNNGIGVYVGFSLGAGSTLSGTAGAWSGSNFVSTTGAVSVVGTNGATFYITGVQLEKGTQATSFDYRPYGTELALCQRYFETFATSTDSVTPYQGIVGFFATTTQLRSCIPMKVTKRASPTVTIPTTNVNINYSGGNANASSPSSNFVSNETVGIQISLASGSSTTGYAGTINFFTGNPVLISSEL
jgi:hypothetical protein